MATILYVFPHPDDESFGPAAIMARQRREGHWVHLLTLTRGGATRQRHRLGLSVQEMGEVRFREMQRMAEALDLSELVVLDLPDGGLAEMDPRDVEAALREHIGRVRPDVLISYPVHGISAFPDHLVMHAVAKRVFCEFRDTGPDAPRRLAFFTLPEVPEDPDRPFRLSSSAPDAIDCVVPADPEDLQAPRRALACYETYREIIEEADPMGTIGDRFHFEIFDEEHRPPLDSLTARLPERRR